MARGAGYETPRPSCERTAGAVRAGRIYDWVTDAGAAGAFSKERARA
jgi:hypothetical protein